MPKVMDFGLTKILEADGRESLPLVCRSEATDAVPTRSAPRRRAPVFES